MKIAHISDIHWRGLSRHSEYTRAFEAVFAKLREMRPDFIFLGGDFFHTKTSGISPEVIKAMNHPQVQLYKESGNYAISANMKPVVLHIFSCFDKAGWVDVAFGEPNGPISIAAFHGSVGGTTMDNGWVMPDSKAEVQLSMFRGYDFVLLGDIHKRQFLAEPQPDTFE